MLQLEKALCNKENIELSEIKPALYELLNRTQNKIDALANHKLTRIKK